MTDKLIYLQNNVFDYVVGQASKRQIERVLEGLEWGEGEGNDVNTAYIYMYIYDLKKLI